MKKYIASFFFVAVIGNVQATEITEMHVTGTRFKFTAKLDAPLIAGNKVKIDFGKNLVPMTCVETTCTLFRTMNSDVMPAYKIGIYNSKNVLQVAETHTATKSYTKIANDGSELLDSAQLGTNPKDWACTKDNKTGLIWEVKTTDGGLRDENWTYTNYTLDYPKCAWAGCEIEDKGKYGDARNADGFVTDVNLQNLCGSNDWRLPMKDELAKLVYCSDSNHKSFRGDEIGFICAGNETGLKTSQPTINKIYFPNTKDDWYWSSSRYANDERVSWLLDFSYGRRNNGLKSDKNFIRLVRNAK